MSLESLFTQNLRPDSSVIFPNVDSNNIDPTSFLQFSQTAADPPIVADTSLVGSSFQSFESWLTMPDSRPLEMTTDFSDISQASTEELDFLTGNQLRKAAAITPASKDPGNTSKTATVVKLTSKPMVKNEEIGFTGDTNDYYKFTLKQEQSFELTLDGLGQDANVRLLENNGKNVIVQSANTGKQKETIDKILPAGTYYVQVYPEKGAKTKYKLSMSASTIVEDEDGKIAGAKDLGQIGPKGKPWTGEIGFQQGNQRDVNDYYRLQLTGADNQLNVVLDGLKQDANIQLLDSDGKTILATGNAKGNKHETIDQPLEAGTYYLKVFPQSSAKTAYNLKVTADAIADPDGRLAAANNLGKLASKTLKKVSDIGFERSGVRDSKDYYQFAVTKESDVNIVLDGLKQNANLKLLDKQGNLLLGSSALNQKQEVIASILPKGIYNILVEPKGDGRTSYNLSVSGDSKFKEKDDQLPGKSLGKVQTGEIGVGKGTQLDQDDYYNFALKKESEVTITLDGLSRPANIELYDSDGTSKILSSIDQKDKSKNLNSILDAGKYYVRVKSKGDPAKYKLSLDINAKIKEPDDQLPGTGLGELTEKTINKSGKIGLASQSTRDLDDYYNFVVTEKSNVNINLDGLSASTTVKLLNTDGQILETKTTKKADSLSRNLEPGTYYLQIEAGKTGTNYKLGINAQLSEDDHGTVKLAKVLGELDQQDELLEGNQIGFEQGGLRDQSDYYIFTLTETSDFNLILDNLKANANVQLLAADGKKVLLENFAKGTKSEELNSKKLAAGTYYVRVFPVGNAKTSYNLRLGTSKQTIDVSGFKLDTVDGENWLAGEKVNINYQLSNNGDTAIADVKVGFYLSPDANIDTSDRQLGTTTIKSLASRKNTALIKQQLTLPGITNSFWNDSGEYYLGMIADPDNKLKEDNENNNVIGSIASIQLPTDLSGEMTAITPSVKLPGAKIPINYTISNSTGNKADSFRVGFYLSPDNNIDPYLDRFLGSKQIKSLAGKSNTGQLTTEITLPDSNDYFWYGISDYYLGMIVDDQKVIGENKEKNNITSQQLSLGEVPLDQAGNTLVKARAVGVVNSTSQNFSDWVGNYYNISTDESDYYQIDIAGNSELKLDLTGLSSNANLYLYNSDGGLISRSELDGNQNDSISYKVLPGKYYALVSQNDGGNTQYNLAMSATPSEEPADQAGNTLVKARAVGVVNSTSQNFSDWVGNYYNISTDESDYYQIDITEKGELKLDLTGLSGNANVYLYNSDNSIISSSELDGNQNDSISYKVLPGKYYVLVSQYDGGNTQYNLAVSATPLSYPVPVITGNTVETALNINVNDTAQTFQEYVGNPFGVESDKTDYYKLTVGNDTTLELNLTGLTANANLYLDDLNSYSNIASSEKLQTANETITKNLTPATYYVRVESIGDAKTTYNLQVTGKTIPNNQAGDKADSALDLGTLTSTPAQANDWVGDIDNTDYYKVTLSQSGVLNLNLTGNASLALYNDNNQYITDWSQGLLAGNYYIQIASDYGRDINYSLQASVTTNFPADNAGNTFDQAKDLGTITTATESDWVWQQDTYDAYKFTVANPGTTNIELTGLQGNANIYLYNSDVTDTFQYLAYSSNDGVANEKITKNLQAGTYYVGVDNYYGYATPYTLSLSHTIIPDNAGDDLATAKDLGAISQTPATLSDWIGAIDTQDWAKFTLTEDTSINLQLGGITGANLTLYDANNSSIDSASSISADINIQRNLTAGTYYVLVEYAALGDTNYNLQVSGTAIPDNGPDTQATALDLGAISQTPTTLDDWVGGIDTQDWAKFTLSQNASVNLQLGGMTGYGSLYLYDANSSEIGSASAYAGSTGAIQQNLLAGTYYVLVEGSQDTNYNLQISGTAIPDNGPDTQATALDLGAISQTPATLSDWVGSIDTQDWAKFTLTEDTSINLQLGGITGDGGNLVANLVLYDANNSSIVSAYTYADLGGTGPIQQNLAAGTYYVLVEYAALGDTNYNLQVSGTAIPDNGPDTQATAKDLGAISQTPTTLDDWVGGIDTQDWAKFTLTEDTSINLQLGGITSDSTASTYLYLYDANSSEIGSASAYAGSTGAIQQNLVAGTYYVLVGSMMGDANYNLQISGTAIPDNGPDTQATALDLGAISQTPTTLSDWVGSFDTQDWAKFTLSQNASINLQLGGMTGYGSLYLYDANSSTINSAYIYPNTPGTINQNLLAGTYYVLVEGSQDTNYNLQVSGTAIPDNGPDTQATALDLGVISQTPTTLDDWVGGIDTKDWAKFTLTEDTSINLQLGGITSDSTASTYLSLYDANSFEIVSAAAYAGSTGGIQQNLVAGTYYVLVGSMMGDTNYNLQVSGTAIPDNGPDTQATALDLGAISQTPTTLSDWIGTIDTQDWAKFTLTEDTSINLQLGGITGANLILYDANSSSIDSASSISADINIQRNLTAGTYYVLVEYNYLGDTNYNLQVSGTAIPDNGPDTQATALDLGAISQTPTTLSDWVGSFDTQDWAKFTLTEDTSINLQLGGITGDTHLSLYDASNSNISSDYAIAGSTGAIQQNLVAGTYYVLVEYQYLGDTNYNLQVSGTPILGGY